MRIRAKNLARELMTEGVQLRGQRGLEASACYRTLQESLDNGASGQPGGVHPSEFSMRDLAGQLIFNRSDGQPVGDGFVQEYMDPTNVGGFSEAVSAVDSSMFAGIMGQLLITSVRQGYQAEDFVVTKLVPTVPTRLSGERIPGVYMPSDPGDDTTIVREGEEYRTVGFGETYVETPATVKRGIIIPVTKEAIFFDRTGMVIKNAGEVGALLGLRKEKNIIDVVIGAVNPYKEKIRTDSAIASRKTFYSATDSGPWTNHFDGNALTDWTNIEYAEQQFAAMTDPHTGEPILLPNSRLLLAPQIKMLSINQLLGATQVWKLSAGLASAGVNTLGPNPIQNLNITMAVSRQLAARLTAFIDAATGAGYWFYGDIAKAFAYMENWPITVVQAPSNSEAEFTQDIVVRFKASERGAPAVMEPRAWQRHRTLATSSSSGA
jgi:hypothetical protein